MLLIVQLEVWQDLIVSILLTTNEVLHNHLMTTVQTGLNNTGAVLKLSSRVIRMAIGGIYSNVTIPKVNYYQGHMFLHIH